MSNRNHNSRWFKQFREFTDHVQVYLKLTEADEACYGDSSEPSSFPCFPLFPQCFLQISFILMLAPFEVVQWLPPERELLSSNHQTKVLMFILTRSTLISCNPFTGLGKVQLRGEVKAKFRTFKVFSTSLKIGVSLIWLYYF